MLHCIFCGAELRDSEDFEAHVDRQHDERAKFEVSSVTITTYNNDI